MRRLAFALLAAAALVFSGCQSLGQQPSAAKGAEGRIAWPKDGDLWVFDLVSKQQTRITSLPQGAAVTGATWSPDGQQVVYAQFWRRPNERSSGADLMIANKDGSEARVFAERDAANTVLEAPEWAPSGRVYYDIRRVANGRETQTVVRQVDGGQPESLVDNAYNPTVSPDETTLVYIRSTRNGQSMMKKNLTESGDGCELIADSVFQYLSQPRIAPDGKRVALGGSGEPNNAAASGCGGDPRTHPSAAGAALTGAGTPPSAPMAASSRMPLGLDLGALLQPAIGVFLPSVAYAHGLPADVYSLNLDGSDMQRVADIKDDDPTVAFSPDGTRLAIFGVAALYMVDARGGPPDKLVDQGGYGGLDWTR